MNRTRKLTLCAVLVSLALARNDARALLEADPQLTSARGQAIRALLWFMDQDKAIRLMAAG